MKESSKSHPAFKKVESEHIASLNIVMEKYVHLKTNALHYHLASSNTENVFLIAFRTVPTDSTGVAHILEHTALCGSERYPVRDPFFMMIRRSLNTFMNAFTSSDWTAYPFASKNKKDFNNLLNVYLDASFFSRLHELDFLQEGHRLEFTEPLNPSSELQYKGVVFNEMKGAMSSTNSVLWQTMSKYLYPTTTYHHNSGGEPDHIPDLTYDDLVSFYKSHYHPSNSVIMTFGDIPACNHQQNFESLALSRFEKLNHQIKVNDEKRYLSPIRVEEFYAAKSKDKNENHVVLGWLLGKSTSLIDLFKAQLLTSVLLDNSASPLLKVLETTNLGSAPSPMCGLEDSSKEMSFMAGLEGCSAEATLKAESLILRSLQTIADEGVPTGQVEAALHQLELNQREISGDSYPYGLQLILYGLSTALHRGDPISLLNIDPVLEELKVAIKEKEFIPNLIKELLLENPHRVTLTMRPDYELSRKKIEAEKTKLQVIKSSLSEEEMEIIVEQSRALTKRQNKEDDPSILPKVSLSDVPEELSEPPYSSSKLSPSEITHNYFEQGTNGITYQQIIVELPQIEDTLLEVLPLYTSCLPEFGINEKNYEEVQTWQAQISGGVNCYSSIRSQIDDVQTIKSFVTLSSKALTTNAAMQSELLYEMFSNVNFDEPQRLSDLIKQICTRKENNITGQGHTLAMVLASSEMSPAANLSHTYSGLKGIQQLKEIRKKLDDSNTCRNLLEKFKALHQTITGGYKQVLSIAEPGTENKIRKSLEEIWPISNSPDNIENLVLPKIRNSITEAWTTDTQVNFCAKAFPTVPSNHRDNATLHVLAGYLRNGFLHRAIREQGGAYGGGASQDSNSATFKFFSYRDPRLSETLRDFEESLSWLIDSKQAEYQLEEAILGVIASLDKPGSPAGEAKQAFYNQLFGRTLDHRLAFRQQVLSTTLEDLKAVVERYFDSSEASIGIITNKEQAEKLEIQGFTVRNI